MTTFSADRLKTRAAELGFDRIGLTPAVPSATLDAYLRWIDAGMHGTMGYMARPDRVQRRRELTAILPGARSLIVVALDYRSALPAEWLNDPARGRIAAYAWGQDYHAVLLAKLEALAVWLEAESGGVHRAYVDTGALLERSHGQAAGLGFVGKNTMLIHPRRGSLFFLGEILTTLEFEAYDAPLPQPTMCGSCTRCLSACPTHAFLAPHVLDARRCISYLTIEHKGSIDPALRPALGNWVFGCDVCQDVCPFQRFAPETREPAFAPDPARIAPPLLDLLALDEPGFRTRFAGSPLARTGRDRLVRNACIAAGNWGRDEAAPPLIALLQDASPLVRGHAAWALGRLEQPAALERAWGRETDEAVRGEIQAALAG
ncbi:MAG TPA: tRNA epoxyqueuosine(34) reductase QueG [Candidatus Limnocylindrales bacterium]|nr:tRNA epoxyqueuosine(34) reductase QueG [Candidatus Limnocylindrales bacterium]